MSQEFMLVNLDSGDMLFLGNQRTHDSVPEIGISEAHTIFDEIPHHAYGDEEFKSKRPWLADYIKKTGHRLNFFLSHSRGCRLVVLDVNDCISALAELTEEFAGRYINLNGQDDPKAEFYERRLRHGKSLQPTTEEERRAGIDRRSHYKDELKNILRKNISKVSDDDSSVLNLETGGLRPNPIFIPWDDDRLD